VITFVLGGARSGKSALAERLAAASARGGSRVVENRSSVTYVATMIVGDDAVLAERVAAHRARRPPDWATVEAGADLPDVIETLSGTVLLDSLGPWIAAQPDFVVDADALCAALAGRSGDTIVVSDEVGLGVYPATDLGGAFRDALGTLNQAVAAIADRVLLTVAGRVVTLDRPPDR
jgi:adenosyl cobinamide kinase/adenosyl cobinamide phosphate guanylyltransferase